MSRIGFVLQLSAIALLACSVRGEDFQGSTQKLAYDDAPIRYSDTAGKSPIERLQAKIERGEIQLKFDAEKGYLPSLLKALDVPPSSQLLVFSKTSLQRTYVSPKNARAIYFNDEVYIGYIPGAPRIEVSAVDPHLGGMFYALDQIAAYKPQLVRTADCLQCHGGNRSLGVPGHVVRSIGTDGSGELDTQTEVSEMTHCSPLADRWAGWFVTGQQGAQRHRGNLVGAEAFERATREPGFRANLTNLRSLLDMGRYPANGSDIVAHLVLDHQLHMHNYITRLNFETQIMMSTYGHIRYLDRQVDAFLRYLLFTEEAPLTEAVSGDQQFIEDFVRPALRDKEGRSLRDFDLRTRLFKYPCSFLIYSDAFDALPAVMRERLYKRLWDILNGHDSSPDFAKISAPDRQAIREILLETKRDLPDYWRS